jgi:hypothetical protein
MRATSLTLYMLIFVVRLHRLNAAPGDVDASFETGSGINGPFSTIAIQNDGKLIIAGNFLTVRGEERYNADHRPRRGSSPCRGSARGRENCYRWQFQQRQRRQQESNSASERRRELGRVFRPRYWS